MYIHTILRPGHTIVKKRVCVCEREPVLESYSKHVHVYNDNKYGMFTDFVEYLNSFSIMLTLLNTTCIR